MPEQRREDEQRMKRALTLARRGAGKTSPNPMVGAVIVRGGQVIGEGYHREFGGHHAEIEAVRDAHGDIEGATLYVTLEPCSHHKKKTPPCLDALLEHKLKRVVIGTQDPNPEVSGRSIKALRERGIETTVGVLERECRRLNEAYFKFMRTRTPFVTLKYAQTLDGRIATASSSSQWISSRPSLKLAHRLRSLHDAILLGAGTIIADDPLLTVRLVKGRNPVRVIADARLTIPLNARVLNDQDKARTLVAVTRDADKKKLAALTGKGIETVLAKAGPDGLLDLKDLLKKLGERNISSLLVEGGASIITSFIGQRLADRLVIITAPKIIGRGIEAVADLEITDMGGALQFSFERVTRSGDDIVIEARPR